MEQEKLWTRDFTLSVIVGFFMGMVVHSFITTMAVYSMNKYGASEGLAGFTASIAMIGGILGRLFTGKYMDRIGRRLTAIIMNVLSAGACLLYFLPGNVFTLLLIRLFHGLAGGAVHNVMATAVLDFIPPARRAEGVAIYTLSFTFAIAAGPALGMYIARTWSYETLWLANLGYAIAGTAIILAIRFVPSAMTGDRLNELRAQKGLSGVLEKSALPLSLMILIHAICYAGVSSFTEAYTHDMGIVWIAPVFFIVYAAVMIATRPFAGRMVDQRGENFVMIPSMIGFSVSLVILGLAGVFSSLAAPVLVIASACLMAIGFGASLPLGSAVAVKYAEPHRFSNIITTYFIFSDGGMGVGALIIGTVISGVGFSSAYYISALAVVAALAIYWGLHGRHHRFRPS